MFEGWFFEFFLQSVKGSKFEQPRNFKQ